jgi:hypothetical protein
VIAHTLINNQLGILAQGLSATDRLQAVRKLSGGSSHANLFWWAIVGVTILAVITLIWVLSHTRFSKKRRWSKFKVMGRQLGLRDQEQALLARITEMLDPKDPRSIYNDSHLFNVAAKEFLTSDRVSMFSDDDQAALHEMIVGMHAKMRFNDNSDAPECVMSSRRIEIGSRVLVAMKGYSETIEATVMSNIRAEIVIAADTTMPGRRNNDTLTIRYANDRGSWEFDANVIRSDGDTVAVDHSSDMRAVNFRRFPRVSTRMRAVGEVFPFPVNRLDEALVLRPGAVCEIAGMGLLIKTPCKTRVGQRLLLRVELESDKIVQGVAKVRREVSDKPGGPFLAVEFIGLNEDELAMLARATIHEARTKELEPAPDEQPALV